MRQLFPTPVDDVDPVPLYFADDRPAPPGRPWVLMNMIASIDGGISVDGVSGGLGAPADKAVFGALRALADVIVVAAGTVAAENYRRAQTPPDRQRQRLERGQTARPRIAIVTNSLSLDPTHRVFDPEDRPLVFTGRNAPEARRTALSEVADVEIVGEAGVDLAAMLSRLGEHGAKTVLCEGGPTLNGAMIADDLIDEVCLSLSPMLLGGQSPRIAHGELPSHPTGMRLDRILEGDGLTFHRWVRA